MRIAFLGKGGSGKTTAAAGFVRYAAQKHPFVLAIDADVNAHMYQALNLDITGKQHELRDSMQEISDYLKGERTDLGERPMISTTPPTLKSNFVMVSPDDPFLRRYTILDNGISLMTVGGYKESDVGASCFHELLYTLACVMHHTLDTDDDIVIADTTAGIDNVATSLHFAYDLNVFIVEPTEKSVKVFHDFVGLHSQLAEGTFVVANKVDGQEDEAFIKKAIPSEKLLGLIPQSDNLKRFEQGEKEALKEFQIEQRAAFDAIYSLLRQRKRNWTTYLEQLRHAHIRLSHRWYNRFHNMQLEVDLDTDFDYDRAIAQRKADSNQRPLEFASAPTLTTIKGRIIA
jgi:CO dehydrogenase maturation factor